MWQCLKKTVGKIIVYYELIVYTLLCHYAASVLEFPVRWGEEWCFGDFVCAVM